MTNLERMEKFATKNVMAIEYVTPVDPVCVVYHSDWAGCQFEYLHNGVRIERDRAFELVI